LIAGDIDRVWESFFLSLILELYLNKEESFKGVKNISTMSQFFKIKMYRPTHLEFLLKQRNGPKPLRRLQEIR
jgi:hypothetical protein